MKSSIKVFLYILLFSLFLTACNSVDEKAESQKETNSKTELMEEEDLELVTDTEVLSDTGTATLDFYDMGGDTGPLVDSEGNIQEFISSELHDVSTKGNKHFLIEGDLQVNDEHDEHKLRVYYSYDEETSEIEKTQVWFPDLNEYIDGYRLNRLEYEFILDGGNLIRYLKHMGDDKTVVTIDYQKEEEIGLGMTHLVNQYELKHHMVENISIVDSTVGKVIVEDMENNTGYVVVPMYDDQKIPEEYKTLSDT